MYILKLQKLDLLAGYLGLAFFFIIWRYKGEPRSTTPGLLRSTGLQIKDGISRIKAIVDKDTSTISTTIDPPEIEEE